MFLDQIEKQHNQKKDEAESRKVKITDINFDLSLNSPLTSALKQSVVNVDQTLTSKLG